MVGWVGFFVFLFVCLVGFVCLLLFVCVCLFVCFFRVRNVLEQEVRRRAIQSKGASCRPLKEVHHDGKEGGIPCNKRYDQQSSDRGPKGSLLF